MGNFHCLFGTKDIVSTATKLKVACFLSILFLGVYGACNYISSTRTDVGELYFAWEAYIPFIPILIIPYMSIDLFFLGAPFLCNKKEELILFVKRIMLGIFIAGAFFLAMPLEFAFERPVPDGWLKPIFLFLHGFDQPYNLFPSLHIILRTILAHKYAEKTSGWLRVVIHVWFFLIGVSTICIYQHHILDIVGGFIVAIVIFYIVREKPKYYPKTKNFRIGYYYIGLFIFLSIIILYFWSWSSLLLIIPLSILIVIVGYFGQGSSIVNKVDGIISLPSKIVLAPWLLGQYLSLLYYKQQCDCWSYVTPNVFIGRVLNNVEADELLNNGVTAVVDMTCEFSEADNFIALNKKYLNIQVLDLTAPSIASLDQVADFIMAESREGAVYVHCKIGYSRSVAAVAAYLLKSNKVNTVKEAIKIIKKARPTVVIREEILNILNRYKQHLLRSNKV